MTAILPRSPVRNGPSPVARLLAIEWRRSVGLWFAPPLALLVVAFARLQNLDSSALNWAWSSVQIRDGVVLIGPALAGAAAWMAGREHRRGLDDLLATTPRAPWRRRLATWGGLLPWGVLAYVVGGGHVAAVTWQRAVWGGPFWSPILIGLLALPTHAALGFAIGRAFPARLVAPLVAVGLFFAQVVVGSRNGWFSFLSPVAFLDRSFWYGVRPDVGPQQALVFLGLTGFCLGSLGLRRVGGLAARVAMLASAMLLFGGVIGLAIAAPLGGMNNLRAHGIYGEGTPFPGYDRPLPYMLVCSADPLPVCVHPAYQPLLDTSRTEVNRLVAPLLGLPDGPVRAEQRPASFPGLVGDVLVITPTDTPGESSYISIMAGSLTDERQMRPGPIQSRCPGEAMYWRTCRQAQNALAVWLIRRAELPVDPRMFSLDADAEAAAARFAALDPSAQHAWLAAHYGALRRGEIRLEDMP